MKLNNGTIELSASDVSNHLACKYLTILNAEVARGLRAESQYRDPAVQILQERGQEFEGLYLNGLRNEGLIISEPQKGENGDIVSRTVAAMKSGADVIYQATMKSGVWSGRADFLIKTDKPSQLGDYSYEVLDTKLARETKAGTMLQLCLYTQLVAEIQGDVPEFMYVMTPADDLKPQVYRCDDFMAYFRLVCDRLLKAIEVADITVYPEPVSQCEICSWWRECDQRRRDDDHLSLVAGLSLLNSGEIENWGVETLEELALLSLPLTQRPSRGAIDTYVRLREQARVQLASRETKAPYFETFAVAAGDGLCKLPEPAPGDVFFDLEGDPFVGMTGLEYLFGWVADDLYNQEWSFDAESEKATFEKFVDKIMERWAAFPGMHVYHYTAYEPGALKRLMGKYATRENEIDSMLRADLFIDLYTVTRQSLRAGIERYSLKELEIFYNYERETPLRDAAAALRVAERILERTAHEGLPDELMQTIGEYNKEDCLSTLFLRNWLEELRTQLLGEGQMIPRPELKNGEASLTINEHDRIIKALFDRLMSGLPLEREQRNDAQQAHWILASMLDFYRREDKSKWWEYFRIRELPEDELLEEKLAISYMEVIPGARVPVKKSFIDQYRFPLQECELLNGASLKTLDGKGFGSVAAIDKEQGIVSILKGPSIEHLHPTAVFSLKILSTSEKQEAVIRVSEWIVNNGIDSHLPDYRAARDLLLRNAPRTRAGIDWSYDPLAAALAGMHMLDHSVLPIQGPPGAGKSFTASRMIVEAVKTGKKVGITAMSHKVIQNLLEKVIRAAAAEGISLNCMHKVTDLSEIQQAGIVEETKTPAVVAGLQSGSFQVVGGTAWLWANPLMHDAVDFLFVDEAGQLSLIDTVAAGQSAKDIILLGDPQQLKQPQQGSHPEGTEVSSLEHILQGHQTIPPERGIFLGETWRMHPNICRFISELFYDKRLHSRPGLEKQILSGHPTINGAGLWFLPVEHDGNQSVSNQEAKAIKELVDSFLSGNVIWTDSDDKSKVLTQEDIKIIAPYNAQVQEIIATLPYPIQTGTVDKFQGQEAPVIIFSMATSTPENAPRGMDFLYSLNRLNVAVSRARTACIIVASPKLFEPDCKSPAQIKQANSYCRYLEIATVLSMC